jgi:hypothetical protein
LPSITTCGLLPKIFCLRSFAKPPITLVTEHRAHEETQTPRIDSTLMTVKKPLFVALTWRAATNGVNADRSSRSSASGKSVATRKTRKTTPAPSEL